MAIRRKAIRRVGTGRAGRVFGLALLAVLGVGHSAVRAEMRPSLNLYGGVGLIDMPSAERLPDGYLGFSSSYFGPIKRTTVTFQITPSLTGSFRYSAVGDWDAESSFYDRTFDLRYQIRPESTRLPALAIGLQDAIGTGLQSGEYLVATKTLLGGLKVTAGLGWGRLASAGSIGALFGARPQIDLADGNSLNTGQWFRGEVAPFGGLEWQINDRWTAKAEYSSDSYAEESGLRGSFDYASPLNFGLEYHPSDRSRFGVYYLYGSEIGLSANIILNPGQRPDGGIGGSGPAPVKPRPPPAADPEVWSPEWVTQNGVNAILMEGLISHTKRSGIRIAALGFTGEVAQVRILNPVYDAEAQAVGRVARAMTYVMPASIEVFEIIPMVNGIPASKITLRRSDVEALEFAPDGAAALRARTVISDAGQPIAGLTFNPEIYPRFQWSLAPYVRLRYFSPETPLVADLGLRLSASYEFLPGLVLSGAVTQKAISTIQDSADRGPAIDSLTAAWNGRIGTDLYARVTIGMLERGFGGVSSEVLWKPSNRAWALGVDANYVARRDAGHGLSLGFDEDDYRVATGHVSGYFDLGRGYSAQLDVGRYLAGDVGATVTLARAFQNGWKIGAFATVTDGANDDPDGVTFDKGIAIEIPLAWFSGRPSRVTNTLTLRSLGQDAGARLNVAGRLYDRLSPYGATGLDAQWGRFWK